jgi:hypothetical protein
MMGRAGVGRTVLVVVAAVVLAGSATVALVLRSGDGRRSALPAALPVASTATNPPRDRIYQSGVITAVPSMGTLSWHCSDASQFIARYTAARPFATQTVKVVASDGTRRQRRLTPRRAELTAAPQGVGAQQWSISLDTEPAAKSVTIAVRYAMTKSSRTCYVNGYTVRAETTAHAQ